MGLQPLLMLMNFSSFFNVQRFLYFYDVTSNPVSIDFWCGSPKGLNLSQISRGKYFEVKVIPHHMCRRVGAGRSRRSILTICADVVALEGPSWFINFVEIEATRGMFYHVDGHFSVLSGSLQLDFEMFSRHSNVSTKCQRKNKFTKNDENDVVPFILLYFTSRLTQQNLKGKFINFCWHQISKFATEE